MLHSLLAIWIVQAFFSTRLTFTRWQFCHIKHLLVAASFVSGADNSGLCGFSLIEVGGGSKAVAPLAQGSSEAGYKPILARPDKHFPS